MKKTKARSWILVPPILIAVLIFVMSSFVADESDAQSGLIVSLITAVVPAMADVEFLVTIVRKLAHFTEYALLGFFTARAMKAYDQRIVWAIPLCVGYAITDELHQLLVPGRSCQVVDILIDGLGASCGVGVYYLIC